MPLLDVIHSRHMLAGWQHGDHHVHVTGRVLSDRRSDPARVDDLLHKLCRKVISLNLMPCLQQVARHRPAHFADADKADRRSEKHTSELTSLMRISYAVF